MEQVLHFFIILEYMFKNNKTEMSHFNILLKLSVCYNLVIITRVIYDAVGQTLFLVMPYIYEHSKYGLGLRDWMKTYQFMELFVE